MSVTEALYCAENSKIYSGCTIVYGLTVDPSELIAEHQDWAGTASMSVVVVRVLDLSPERFGFKSLLGYEGH